jgi:hypothetical protein
MVERPLCRWRFLSQAILWRMSRRSSVSGVDRFHFVIRRFIQKVGFEFLLRGEVFRLFRSAVEG